jgi:hypothetical protein
MSVPQETEKSIQSDRDKPLMVSSLSTFSMVMGLASCLLLVLVFPALATAALAIIFGHVSAAHVRANKVELLGLGRSRIGLMLGYFCLVVAVFLLPQMDHGRLLVRGMLASDRSAAVGGVAEFSDGILGGYEREVCRNRESSDGDGLVAAELARSFRRELKSVLMDTLELEDGKGLSWDASRLRCHCYRNSGVVFIVREPGLAGFNDAALEMLTLSAWRVALDTVRDSGEIEADYPVAVCLMGKRRCQTFVMGQALNVDESHQEPSYLGPDSVEVLALLQ